METVFVPRFEKATKSSGTSKFQCWPTTATQAKALGLPKYDNGHPCPKGHPTTIRYVIRETCYMCILGKNQRWRSKTDYDWSKLNPEKHREHERKNRAADPDKHRTKNKRWYNANPKWFLFRNENRRARERGAEGFFTDKDVSRIFNKQRGFCVCGKALRLGYTIDHKTPISRGGSNWPDNIQLLCSRCNSSKGTKTDEEWRATFPT